VAALLLSGNSFAAEITLAWDANTEPDLAGYNIYYGTVSGEYGDPVDVKNFTEVTLTGFDEGKTYYFVATAYDEDENESAYSDELVHTMGEPIPTKIQPSTGGSINLRLIEGLYYQDFALYSENDDPVNWIDTDQNNSMVENDSLFKIFDINGNKVLGTDSTLTNIHSHYTGSELNGLSGYELSGKMMITVQNSGIGITFFSQYPNNNVYYRLRKYVETPFGLHPHGTSITGGIKETGVNPIPNIWCNFKINAVDTGTRTEIKAKIWQDGSAEPSAWQVDCFDDSDSRLTGGKIGVWSMLNGVKYWDDLQVK